MVCLYSLVWTSVFDHWKSLARTRWTSTKLEGYRFRIKVSAALRYLAKPKSVNFTWPVLGNFCSSKTRTAWDVGQYVTAYNCCTIRKLWQKVELWSKHGRNWLIPERGGKKQRNSNNGKKRHLAGVISKFGTTNFKRFNPFQVRIFRSFLKMQGTCGPGCSQVSNPWHFCSASSSNGTVQVQGVDLKTMSMPWRCRRAEATYQLKRSGSEWPRNWLV